MKRTVQLITSLFFGLAFSISAAEKLEGPAAEVMNVIRSWDQAYIEKDPARVERFLTDDFVGTWADGETTDKAQELRELKDGTFKLLKVEYKNETVRLYGNTAVARWVGTADEEYKGKREQLTCRCTAILVKGPNGWQIAGVQTTRVEKKRE